MRRLLAVAGLCAGLGCARPAVVETALHGNLVSLQREIHSAQADHRVRTSEIAELAAAVASREVRSARGDVAVRRLEQVRSCAEHLYPVLRDRARRRDDAGALATMILLETGRLQPAPLQTRYRAAPSGAWRAVAARAMIAPEDWGARQAAMVDPDERVRRAALTAAIVSPAADDLDALLEAARVDPDPVARDLAVRAVGALGGARAVAALADRWTRADEAVRRAMVSAWDMPASYAAGGQARLRRVATTTAGLPAVDAAAALAARGGDAREVGVAARVRAALAAAPAGRRRCLRLAPLGPPAARAALEAAPAEPEREVRVMALARLLERASSRDAARVALRELAAADPTHPVALQARAALAAAGDHSVHAALVAELAAPRSYRRRLAALGLIALGDRTRAATALGDDDPYVRTSVACAILENVSAPTR